MPDIIIPNILTIQPTGKEPIPLQYHPASLTMSERNFVSNRPGLDGTITFVPQKNISENSIRITTYFTALIPKKDEAGGELLTAGLVGLALTGLSTSETAMDFVEGVFGGVSLAKGWYDIISGHISSTSVTVSPISLTSQKEVWAKIFVLDACLHEATECKIIWDVDNGLHSNQKYIITQINQSVERIRESDGKSLRIRLDLTLMKQGVRIEVI